MAWGKPPVWRAAGPQQRAHRTTWLAAGSLSVAFALWCVFALTAHDLPPSVTVQVPGVARALAAGLFLTAGVQCLARWRLTDDQRSARAAAALILTGVGLPLIALVGPLMQTSPQLTNAVPAARLSLVVPVLALVARRPSRARPVTRPLQLAAVLLAGWVGATITLSEWAPAGALLPMDNPGVWLAAECLAAATWLLLAATAWRAGRREARATVTWVALALVLMGMYELLKAQTIAEPPTTFGLGPGVQVLAATVLAVAAGAQLREAHRAVGSRSTLLAQALADVHEQLARVQQLHRERVHDARSAVIAVIGASQLLGQPPAQDTDPDRLRALMAAELDRLQATLDSDTVEAIVPFTLVDVLGPVLLAHRLAGGTIEAELGSVCVVGRPRTTATAVANLLANTRAHAPGAHVTVTAEHRGPSVVLTVDDDGAGIAPADRERVQGRGVRGAGTPAFGTGLGLYTATTAMSAQAGTLRLTERPGGGTRAVLTLPSPHRRALLSAADSTRRQAS